MVIRSDKHIKVFGLFFGGSQNIRAIALWPNIYVASNTIIDDELINHEKIHLTQQKELLILPFYIWYLIELYTKGYRNISFEKEAYANEHNLTYLNNRRIFSFIKYL